MPAAVSSRKTAGGGFRAEMKAADRSTTYDINERGFSACGVVREQNMVFGIGRAVTASRWPRRRCDGG